MLERVATFAHRVIESLPAGFGRVVRQLRREMIEDRVTGLAAETAFFMVLSVLPGLLLITALLGFLDNLLGGEVATEARTVVLDLMRRALTERASPAVDAVEDLFEQQRGGVMTFSVAVSIWAMTRGFTAVIRALTLAYDLQEQRTWMRQRTTAMFLALGSVLVGALMLAAFVSGPLLGGARAAADALRFGDVFVMTWGVLRWPLAFGIAVVWAAAVYHFGVAREGRLKDGLPGALLTSLFGLGATLGFSLYLRLVSSANPVLGGLGGGLILLIWIYLLSLGLLIGGELNAILAAQARRRDPQGPGR